MGKFRYDILIRITKNKKIHWISASNPKQSKGTNVFKLLNVYGAKGWEVVASGDFGADSRSEIILKQQVS